MDVDDESIVESDVSRLNAAAGSDATNTTILDLETGTLEPGKNCFLVPEHVRRALDLTDSKGSLLKLLKRCGTLQGTRLMEQWLIHPLTRVEEIEDRLELVELFVNSPSFRNTIADVHVKKFPDFAPLVKRLERKRVTLQDLYKIYVAVQRIPALVHALAEGLDGVSERAEQLIREKFISKLETFFGQLGNYRQLIKESIDIAHAQKTGEYRIRPDITPELQKMNEKQERLLELMKEDWSKLSREVGLEKEKALKFERDRDGYMYRVTSKEEKKLRPHIGRLGIIRKKDKTSGFCFQTPELKDLDAKHKDTNQRYETAQEEVMKELIATAATFHEPCGTFNQLLAPLDVICALARVASEANIPYTRPKILPKEAATIELTDSRHPCIENFLQKDFIANSVRFKKDTERLHIVTGLNMGGKSTYVRQVALNIILAQIGSFVPCSSAVISLVDGIFTRIGSGDSVSKGISTFMMEMLETQDILKIATRFSLIIIDELGRGTSTYDGYGLAYAVAEHIAVQLGSYCMFTTHFNELAELQKEVESVVLSQVTAMVSDDGIVFQYLVRPGVAHQSFGVNIAKLTGMPSHVVEESAVILAELEKTHALGLAALAC